MSSPYVVAGIEILQKILTIAASPQGLEILARLLGPSLKEIDTAVAELKDAPAPTVTTTTTTTTSEAK